ncbi:hypothetical protein ACFWGP_05545 [Agromyces sp. NPDC127015]|uniref:hypothetical protein n=1 Tax=Agromyces sp. NPDC127015 TaxID=3347108 RepID=UPI003647C8BE
MTPSYILGVNPTLRSDESPTAAYFRAARPPSPDAIKQAVKSVMPGARADVELNNRTDGYRLRVDARLYSMIEMDARLLHHGGAQFAVEQATAEFQRKLIDDFGIDSFAARRVVELEHQLTKETGARKALERQLENEREASAERAALADARAASIIRQAQREHARVDTIRDALGVKKGGR